MLISSPFPILTHLVAQVGAFEKITHARTSLEESQVVGTLSLTKPSSSLGRLAHFLINECQHQLPWLISVSLFWIFVDFSLWAQREFPNNVGSCSDARGNVLLFSSLANRLLILPQCMRLNHLWKVCNYHNFLCEFWMECSAGVNSVVLLLWFFIFYLLVFSLNVLFHGLDSAVIWYYFATTMVLLFQRSLRYSAHVYIPFPNLEHCVWSPDRLHQVSKALEALFTVLEI